jgi:hypothetical protein
VALKRRTPKKFRSFDMSVSYKMGETKDRFRDALNVFSNQGRLETRFGRERYNGTGLGGPVQSLSFFEPGDGPLYLIAKIGTVLYVVNKVGAPTVIKTGLDADAKHRGVTWARGSSTRHIIAIGNDGLFQFDGTNFSQLGQEPPTVPTVSTITGALANGTYRVALTFYSSSTGFESNAGPLSSPVITTAQGISVSAIPTTAPNKTIDKVRIYLQKVGVVDGPFFITELSLGTTSYSITNDAFSTEIPPISNSKPLAGGAQFIAEFNRKLVHAGNSEFKNDVYFSEEDLPDAFNDGAAAGRLVLYATLNGSITGLATGLYNNSVLDPFLVVFKERSTHIYSEIGGESKFVPISREIGCVSHDTISVKNGAIYFLSEQGWRVIVNGSVVIDQLGNPATLGGGDIDDIFRSPGYAYEANQNLLRNSFSVYFSALDQYMTWIAEGAGTEFRKTYVFEYRIGGFKPYQFLTPSTSACVGREPSGEAVYMGDANGFIYIHSTSQERSDQNAAGEAMPIEAFALPTWLDGDDMDATFNFKELILKRLAGTGNLQVKVWINYGSDESTILDFENELSGFILDVSIMDVDAFGSTDRSLLTSRADVNLCGENILLGFYQNSINQNIGLVSAQLDFNKNGNRNT